MTTGELPLESFETVFLDAGNTLIAMDYPWVGEELDKLGIRCNMAGLRRAEAAARPAVSRSLRHRSTEGTDTFALYLDTTLHYLGVRENRQAIVEALVPVLRGRGRDRLWSFVLPGVPEALSKLRGLGLNLSVVSNSDGSVERVLTNAGLRELLDEVFDSHIVGFEKPDPRLFHHAIETTGADPAATLHVGDLYAADIEGARAAGLHAALLDPYDDWDDVDCPRFTDLASLADAIARARA
jgi:HAD superfamily hydrolase (TIGR01509 family)